MERRGDAEVREQKSERQKAKTWTNATSTTTLKFEAETERDIKYTVPHTFVTRRVNSSISREPSCEVSPSFIRSWRAYRVRRRSSKLHSNPCTHLIETVRILMLWRSASISHSRRTYSVKRERKEVMHGEKDGKECKMIKWRKEGIMTTEMQEMHVQTFGSIVGEVLCFRPLHEETIPWISRQFWLRWIPLNQIHLYQICETARIQSACQYCMEKAILSDKREHWDSKRQHRQNVALLVACHRYCPVAICLLIFA